MHIVPNIILLMIVLLNFKQNRIRNTKIMIANTEDKYKILFMDPYLMINPHEDSYFSSAYNSTHYLVIQKLLDILGD